MAVVIITDGFVFRRFSSTPGTAVQIRLNSFNFQEYPQRLCQKRGRPVLIGLIQRLHEREGKLKKIGTTGPAVSFQNQFCPEKGGIVLPQALMKGITHGKAGSIPESPELLYRVQIELSLTKRKRLDKRTELSLLSRGAEGCRIDEPLTGGEKLYSFMIVPQRLGPEGDISVFNQPVHVKSGKESCRKGHKVAEFVLIDALIQGFEIPRIGVVGVVFENQRIG